MKKIIVILDRVKHIIEKTACGDFSLVMIYDKSEVKNEKTIQRSVCI